MKPMLLTSFMFLLFVGCKQVELAEETSQIDTINYDILVNGYVSSNEVLQRAYQMASVEWTPISPVPFRTGIPYESGKPVKGIPYWYRLLQTEILPQKASRRWSRSTLSL